MLVGLQHILKLFEEEFLGPRGSVPDIWTQRLFSLRSLSLRTGRAGLPAASHPAQAAADAPVCANLSRPEPTDCVQVTYVCVVLP